MTNLIIPSEVGRHIASTFYVEYSNTGNVAMPAPVLLLESSNPDERAAVHLNSALQTSGFWTSAIPQGYSSTVQILASGKVPGMLEPGESVTVPVYYGGMEMPWAVSQTQFGFDLRRLHHQRHRCGRLGEPAVELATRGHLRPGLGIDLRESDFAVGQHLG